MITEFPSGVCPLALLPAQDGFLFLDPAKFHFFFADDDVDADTAAFMANSQVPWGVGALTGAITAPAWRTRPSWYLVATDDRMIPPAAQRVVSKRAGSTVSDVAGSHAVYVSQPKAVAAFTQKVIWQAWYVELRMVSLNLHFGLA